MNQNPGRLSPLPGSRARSLFGVGFVAGFFLLSLLSCGGLIMATGLSQIDLADLQGNGKAWSPPEVTPMPAVVQTVASDGPTAPENAGSAFQAGDQARNITSSRVNIRNSPGYLGKPDGDILAQTLPGETVEILGDRALADGLVWWRVRYRTGDGRMVSGWMAEATASGVQILGR
jgi:hypothetical protein